MKIGVLTSSRADFGIYLPLLNVMKTDNFFQLEIIAFGSHLSHKHGYTLTEIENNFSKNIKIVNSEISDGDAYSISLAAGDVHKAFSTFWNENEYDLVLCLGDRYEMNAAIQSSIPWGVKFAHFHGGEKTLGAFDNIYRHQISLASKYHFTSTDQFANRVKDLLDENKELVYSVGSLSLSDLTTLPLINRSELLEKYNLPNKPFLLGTFHPETIGLQNDYYGEQMIKTFKAIPISHHLVISMPNADTNGSVFREALNEYQNQNPDKITLIESFGKVNYFSAMEHAAFIIGNSSSGIIEAASFGKFVLNVGKRQEGRLQSGNCINVAFEETEMTSAILKLIEIPATFTERNQYVKDNTITEVMNILRSIGNGEF